MSQELIGIIVPTICGLRKDIAALGESTRRDVAALNERMAKVEGLFGGFTKSSPRSTPQ